MTISKHDQAKKILHIAETVQGGVGNYMIDLITRQQADFGASNVRFAVPENFLSLFPEQLHPTAVNLPVKDRSAMGLVRMARAIARIIRSERPDVLFLHSSFAGVLARVQLKAQQRPRVIYVPHGWAFQMAEGQTSGAKARAKSKLFAAIERSLLNKTDHVICVAEEEAIDAKRFGINSDKVKTILTGLYDDGYWRRMNERSHAPIQVAFIGRLSEQKGAEDLLHTIESCDPSIVEFHVVGDGDPLIRQALNGLPHVTAYGWVERARALRILSRADVLFMPSKWEGLPLTSLEAMRASVALLTSEIAVLKNLVEKNVCGVSANSVEGYAQALMSRSRQDWHRLGDAGREGFLRDHQFDRMVARLNELALNVEPTVMDLTELGDVPLGQPA